jgi:hypothetical protein
VAHTPQHNGIAERMNRTVMEATRSMLQHAGAPSVLWGEAVMAAILVHNRVTVRTGMNQTPDQLWQPHPDKPSVKHFRVWGCDAWRHVPDSERAKLDSKAESGIFVGYEESRMAYRVLDVNTREVKVSRDIRFDETNFSNCAKLLKQLCGDDQDEDITFEGEMERLTFSRELELVKRISLADHIKAQSSTGATSANESGPSAAAAPASALAPVAGNATDQPSLPSELLDAYARISAQQSSLPATEDEHKEQAVEDRATVPEAELDHHESQPKPSASEPSSASASAGSGPVAAETRRSTRATRGVAPVKYGSVEDANLVTVEDDIDDSEDEIVHALAAEAELQGDPLSLPDPQTYAEAMASPDRREWEASNDSETNALWKKGTFKYHVVPIHQRVIGCKWVFRRKRDRTGAISRRKSRVCAKGFAQRKGVNYNETFSPVLLYKTLRVFLTIVAILDLELLQLDVPNAFLNAVLTDEIFMEIPEGMKPPPGVEIPNVPEGFKLVLMLLKSLYGIKQAPREWNAEFNASIVALGYTRCSSDTCLYVKRSRTGGLILLPVFVDDVFPACSKEDKAEMLADLAVLMHKYDIKELREADVVLGMRVTRMRSERRLKLDQEVYLRRLLEAHGMSECNPAATPQEERSVTRHRTLGDEPDASTIRGLAHYGSIVGELLYAALSTRPDIAHATSVLARAVSNPTEAHWLACKRVLRYLRGTTHLGLIFGGTSSAAPLNIVLEPCFSDADWAGDSTDRRSTTGYLMKVNGSTVSWASKKQPTVALSSAEAEYMAVGAAVQEILWLRTLLNEMGFEQGGATVLYCDNQPAIAIAKDDVHHSRTKHIDIRHHFIRDHVSKKHVHLDWVPTAGQEADILTKPLGRILFTRLRDMVLGMQC